VRGQPTVRHQTGQDGQVLAERRKRGTPRRSRALSCFRQAVMGPRRFKIGDITYAAFVPTHYENGYIT
jgi:hypothetical protein